MFALSHVVVSNGVLSLNTFKDPLFKNIWVTGGLCQCGLARTYGAYFVRSRVTGTGPNEVELLWPANNVWPPEIDFNESGGSMNSTSSTVHYSSFNYIDQRTVAAEMNQWHTWGVVWTPTSISYVVDGRVWGKISSLGEIPNKTLTLDLEQRTLCNLGRQCPSQPVSMQIDWVAEYVSK
jgi:beta-glucanase (GH16 family)